MPLKIFETTPKKTTSGGAGPRGVALTPPAYGVGMVDQPVADVVPDQAPIQMVREDEFRAAPDTFLQNNVLTLAFQRGMDARAPALAKENETFLGMFHSFPRHWFQLVPDEERSTDTKSAYYLTPALEKYVAAYPAQLGELAGKEGLPAVAGEENYIQSAFVQYLSKNVGDAETDIGHTTITKSRDTDGFNPDFVFTDVMNGCALTTTEGEDEDHFTAWHFQNTGSNKRQAAAFRREKNPLDWFGEEEYDSNDHPGLFEATNLFWRDQDTWKILSQSNDTDKEDRSKILKSTTIVRPLSFDAERSGKVASLKRIYVRNGENQLYEAGRTYINAKMAKLPGALEGRIHRVCQQVIAQIQGDIDAVNAAPDIATLNEVATARLALRAATAVDANPELDAIVAILEEMYRTENNKWKIFKDAVQADRLNRAVTSLGNGIGIKSILGKVGWLRDLVAETAA